IRALGLGYELGVLAPRYIVFTDGQRITDRDLYLWTFFVEAPYFRIRRAHGETAWWNPHHLRADIGAVAKRRARRRRLRVSRFHRQQEQSAGQQGEKRCR